MSANATGDSTHAASQAPYTVLADVLFPQPPDSARLGLRIGLDSTVPDAGEVDGSQATRVSVVAPD